jgi:hypothetical protein
MNERRAWALFDAERFRKEPDPRRSLGVPQPLMHLGGQGHDQKTADRHREHQCGYRRQAHRHQPLHLLHGRTLIRQALVHETDTIGKMPPGRAGAGRGLTPGPTLGN